MEKNTEDKVSEKDQTMGDLPVEMKVEPEVDAVESNGGTYNESSPADATSNNKKPDSPTSTAATNTNAKCSKCQRRVARRGCTQLACLTCCDDTACPTHLEAREQAQWREKVLEGETPLQRRAKELRGKAIPSGRHKETGFSYLGDSVVLWDLQQYCANPAWRDEALRKSQKRKTRQRNHDLGATTIICSTNNGNRKKGRTQRFAETMERLYQQSLSS